MAKNFNEMNINTLLTIAIPTHNRAAILDSSLCILLRQINKSIYRNLIEVIISDNASNDNTQEVIKKYSEKFKDIKFKLNLQPFNTGYYGNFKKCREMSSGKYFWLLSDNDHIMNGIIDYLIRNIKSKDVVGAYFFKNNMLKKYDSKKEMVSVYESDLEYFLKNEKAYRLTLISAVVMLNDKIYDEVVYEKYKDNSFLGFLFLCNAFRKNKKLRIICGEAFVSVPCNVYFNIFESWTKHISRCIDYMTKHNIINNKLKEYFVNSFLRHVVYRHVYNYRIKGEKLHGKHYGSITKIESLLNSFYIQYDLYKHYIVPLFSRNIIILKGIDFLRRLKNKVKRSISDRLFHLIES